MTKFYRTLSLSVGVAMLAAGCASGPQYKDVASSIPTLAADHGRIYFFRSDSFGGAMIQPEIKLNDKVVGHSVPGGFFYVDETPGDYTVSTTTETKKEVTFALHAGDTKYVRTSISMGILVGHITPTLDDPDTAPHEIEQLKYIGAPATTAAR
ncbi:DUF2846 domain-containing protein [Paraburkholderia bannensis]|uniref:DUF2846 domain-containing protein n=1 Tax=Paraburkholderia tropica TaxID=92647 RepID=A0AAQ1GAX8_9BURK|nr:MULTISPECIES: DUF2846 domain-containing protein [Paraburkholderia]QNB14131.1 DUF2846 domain-containing protein [Paraburkholderia tropica]RQM50362.1 DUF2846 domain-containing protein [Paraburkholderia bannensis]RQN40158.1 DUF2846 domain-containing protein [Paraburkholderia tropica]SEI82073.1 Protein of unknown function [Paraburkholderia tropica]